MNFEHKITITADSTCDLPADLIRTHQIPIIPLSVSLGENTYKDMVEVKPADLFDFVEKTGQLPKTAAPSPDDYYAVFEAERQKGNSVVHFSISSELSASCNNANIAAKRLDEVYVVDSENLSTGIGLLILKACEMAASGSSAQEIAEAMEVYKKKVEASFVVDTLDYLHKGGRCSSVAALGSNLLKIKPCIEVQNGGMHVGKKYQGSLKRCLEKYIKDRLSNREDIDTSRIFITSSSVDEEILAVCNDAVNAIMQFDEILISQAGSTISSHCGPGTLGILFCRK